MRFFTPKEDEFLKANCMTVPCKRMAIMLGRSEGTARQRLKLLGIEVPAEIRAQFKKLGQIKKGNIPPNKGKKMSKELYGKCRPTMFKKGSIPPNTKYDGAISIRTDNDAGKSYKYIRLKKAKWMELHRHIWKQAGNKIPKGHIVVFKDGNQMNCVLENLECITREENMKRNGYYNYPQEISQIIQLQGALTRQINKHNEKQNIRSQKSHVRTA